MNEIKNIIDNISLADIETLIELRENIIRVEGFEQALPLERIINALDQLKTLI